MGDDGEGAAAIDLLGWRHGKGATRIKPSLKALASREMSPISRSIHLRFIKTAHS
jgi:hypothetical protein